MGIGKGLGYAVTTFFCVNMAFAQPKIGTPVSYEFPESELIEQTKANVFGVLIGDTIRYYSDTVMKDVEDMECRQHGDEKIYIVPKSKEQYFTDSYGTDNFSNINREKYVKGARAWKNCKN